MFRAPIVLRLTITLTLLAAVTVTGVGPDEQVTLVRRLGPLFR